MTETGRHLIELKACVRQVDGLGRDIQNILTTLGKWNEIDKLTS